MRENAPLKVKVEKCSKLVIEIGTDTLARAADYFVDVYEDHTKVVDSQLLSEDIVRLLTEEDEDGSTLVSKMLDEAILKAFDDGSLAFAPQHTYTFCTCMFY